MNSEQIVITMLISALALYTTVQILIRGFLKRLDVIEKEYRDKLFKISCDAIDEVRRAAKNGEIH